MRQREADRIVRLIEHLRDPVTKDHFDLDKFLSESEGNTLKEVLEEKRIGCGTVGCVLGHMTVLWPRTFKAEYEDPNTAYDVTQKGFETSPRDGIRYWFGFISKDPCTCEWWECRCSPTVEDRIIVAMRGGGYLSAAEMADLFEEALNKYGFELVEEEYEVEDSE